MNFDRGGTYVMDSSQNLDGAKGSAAPGSIKGANCCMKAKSASDSLTCAGDSGNEVIDFTFCASA